MQQKTMLFADVSTSLNTQTHSEEEPGLVELPKQKMLRRSFLKHAVLLGMVGGMALIVTACGTGSSTDSNDISPPDTNNNSSSNSSNSSGTNNTNGANNSSGSDGSSDGSDGSDGSSDGSDGSGDDN